MNRALDRDRLLRDLRAADADLHHGEWPKRARVYWELRGLQRAYRVLLAAIVDGDYDQEEDERGT